MTAQVLRFPAPILVQRFLHLGPNRFFGQWGILITYEWLQHLSVDELIARGRRVLIMPGHELTEAEPCNTGIYETLSAGGAVLLTFVSKGDADEARVLAKKFARPVGDAE